MSRDRKRTKKSLIGQNSSNRYVRMNCPDSVRSSYFRQKCLSRPKSSRSLGRFHRFANFLRRYYFRHFHFLASHREGRRQKRVRRTMTCRLKELKLSCSFYLYTVTRKNRSRFI